MSAPGLARLRTAPMVAASAVIAAAGVGSVSVFCDKMPPHPPYLPLFFKSVWHGHEIPSVRRGYEVYRQVCATCHGMKFIHFRHMISSVYPETRVKQIAAEFDVTDGPNDEGEMFQRPGLTTDKFPDPYPNEEAGRYANGGAAPPDLSVITTARHEGCDHVFAILTGYRDPPAGVVLRPGLYYNTYFPGGALGMPPPLIPHMMDYEDGTPAVPSQMARDVTSFLCFASDPTHDNRKLLGLKVTSSLFYGSMMMGIWYRAMMVTYRHQRYDFSKAILK